MDGKPVKIPIDPCIACVPSSDALFFTADSDIDSEMPSDEAPQHVDASIQRWKQHTNIEGL